MLLTILLALALLAVAGVAGRLYYREVVRNRTRSLIPPVVGVTPGSRPVDHPETVPAWTAPQHEPNTPVHTDARETLAAAEAEARLIMDVASNAARAILEEAEATKRKVAGELAALETRKRELAGECRQMQELHDLLKADLAQIEERVRSSLSSADKPEPSM